MDSADGWKTVQLGNLAELVTKGSSPNWQGFDYCNEGVVFVRSQNVGWGVLELAELAYLPEEFNRKEKKSIIQRNDLLVNIVGASIGRSAIATSSVEGGNLNQAVALVRLKPNCMPEFVMNFLLSEAGQIQLHRQKKDIARANLSLQDIRNLQIPFPPLPEQQAIAYTLRAVQQAREARQRELTLERERKTALMEHLFTHGPRAEAVFSKETRFGRVPKHWQVIPLSECSFVQTGVTKGRYFRNNPTVTLPYLRVANVQDGYLDLTEIKEIEILQSEIDRYRLQAGDVVLTEGGDFDKLGRGFIWHGEIPVCVHQNHVFAVRVNRDLLKPEYFAYFVQSPYSKAYFLGVAHRTTNLASINSAKLKRLPTLIPPLDEQREIANVLLACDDRIAALEREAALLEELFRALLEELMTGRIRINCEL